MNIVCPNCGQTCETYDELVIGQHVLCPMCNVKFTYGTSASASESQNAGEQKDVKCPSCGTEYEVEASEIGREVECEVCGRRFVICVKETPISHSPAQKVSATAQPNGRKVSTKSGTKGALGFTTSTTSIDYERNKKYFSGTSNFIGCGSILAAFVCPVIGVQFGPFGVVFGSIVGFVLAIIIFVSKRNDNVSDGDIDLQASGMGHELDDKALNKLGLDPEEVSMVKPLKLWGYRFVYPCVLGDSEDTAAEWITGKDGKCRSSEVSHTIFYFGENSVYCYVRTASLVNSHVSNERTEEYFYKDIVSVKTDSIVAKRGGESHKVDVFVLVNTGGERLECEVENQSEADSVARAFRTLLKQKKL